MIQRILVATDDSKLSRKAVKAAIDLASCTGAGLVAFHVVPRYPTSYFEGAVAMEPDEVGRVERHWAEAGRAVVDRVAQQAEDAGVKVRAAVAQSDAVADAIMGAVRKHKCDLIVMASHGRRGLSRVLLGSETQHVLTHSTTPVLVIR
jgi:nucleotide-binding universal stress UspA family protein